MAIHLLANHSRDSDVEDIDRCFTIGVDLVVFLVLISCNPVSQPSKRGRDIFVAKSFGGRQREFSCAFAS